MLPSLVIFGAMALVLSVTAVQTLRKGVAMYSRERQVRCSPPPTASSTASSTASFTAYSSN